MNGLGILPSCRCFAVASGSPFARSDVQEVPAPDGLPNSSIDSGCGCNRRFQQLSADPKSLKDIASKLQGRHILSDGRPIMVAAEFLTPDQVNAGHLMYVIREKHAPLMESNSRVYVVYGVTYVAVDDSSGVGIAYTIQKFFTLGCALF